MALTLEIVTPEKRVAQLSCDEVRAPGALGGFGIRPGHASFMSALEPGPLVVVQGEREERYAVGGGFLQVDQDRVIVLADTAEPAAAIDVARAKRAFAEATERLRSLAEQDENHALEAARVRRAAARLAVAGH
ncbi:MAG TPA: F0F1 ATP synthase subunit epsilon [Anaeromyxobacteraceae bacterium]|nr:F0F1 ATP synthase subunit epsilon [Anaeromyxobacteraceae bacterium]